MSETSKTSANAARRANGHASLAPVADGKRYKTSLKRSNLDGVDERLSGSAIVELRQALGLSQEALAKALGVSRVSVARWEIGDHIPSPGHDRAMRDLCDAAALKAGDTGNALATLKSAIIALGPSGVRGFEGLTAQALAAVTGLVVRVSKSGLQFGRDGVSTASNHFAIAFESKLYANEPPSLAELAGKAAVAGFYLTGKVDVWALSCTAPIGDPTLGDITALLEREGVTVVALDWAERPLPLLAVLLAATLEPTLQWFAEYSQADLRRLHVALSVISADPSFQTQLGHIRQQFQASTVGLDALRRNADVWLRTRFKDRRQSQLAFGQWIDVAAPEGPAMPRGTLIEQLQAAITPDPADTAMVALLGEEGVGKTWLMAQWWALHTEPPILCLVPSGLGAGLDAKDPTSALATLFAAQEGRSEDPTAIAAWRRRIARWKAGDSKAQLRFVLVLDGLNERALAPWSELILAFAPELQALGGILVVTTRPGFWRREVQPRIARMMTVREVTVANYSDAELATMLARVGRTIAELPAPVRSFIANPRVCSVALKLLPQLLSAKDLTVERLLLEYWRERLAERASGIRHSVEDFDKLLRLHARAWRTAPKTTFERDEWVDRTGLSKRLGPAEIVNDLTEIEEGRFMTPDGERPGGYVFREEVLPYAMALLINDEVRQGLQNGLRPAEVLDQALSPIQSFDRLADVIAAAIGLACLDNGFPSEGRRALIVYWLRLHNVDDDAFQALTAYLPAQPDAFLEVAELTRDQLGREIRQQSLTALLAEGRDRAPVREALARRASRWLGLWSRQAKILWRDERDAERQTKREAWIDDNLKGLTRVETELVRRFTVEIGSPPSMNLAHSIAELFAARPQAEIAEAFLSWGLAQGLAGDYPDARAELEWSLRLNTIDWNEVRTAIEAATSGVSQGSSPCIRAGVATTLRLLGDEASAERADLLNPLEFHAGWRRLETFCDVDPYDPEVPEPTNLDNARMALEQIKPETVWLHMSSTMEDHDLEYASHGLVRFDPELLVAKFRAVVSGASERTGLPLRQLSWHLPDLSPLFDLPSRQAVLQGLHRLTEDPERVSESDAEWVAGEMAESLIIGATGEEQLDLILGLSPRVPLYLKLRRGLQHMPAQAFEARLEAAIASQDPDRLTRTLFYASGSDQELTERARQRLLNILSGGEPIQRHMAAEIAANAQDNGLYAEFLDQVERRNVQLDLSEEGFSMGRLMAQAVVALNRADLIEQVPPHFAGWVAVKLGGSALEHLAVQTRAVVERLLQPISAVPPEGVEMTYGALNDGLDATFSFDEIEDGQGDLQAQLEQWSDAERGSAQFAERQRAVGVKVKAYKKALTREGASQLGSSPPREGLRQLGQAEPDLVATMLNRILANEDRWALSQVRNLALVLAGSVARSHGALAASIFRKVWDVRSITTVTFGFEKLPLHLISLFQVRDPALEPLWSEVLDGALDDDAIQKIVVAAETEDGGAWLDAYVSDRLSRSEPGHRARGITVAGMRRTNLHSDQVFAKLPSAGFLAEVAGRAHGRYARARWSQHWLDQMAKADDPVPFWRYAQLAIGVADVRALLGREWINTVSPKTRPYLEGVFEQIGKAAEKRSKKYAETLFGLKAPNRELTLLLRDTPATDAP